MSPTPRSRPLEITVVGGGPAGLYFSVLAKQANPEHRITVHERNRADDTFGFGVVFSENTMGFISEQDTRNYPEIMAASRRWDPLTVIHQGTTVRCGGVGFSAIERKTLLNILQGQASALGVELRFQSEVAQAAEPPAADLVVLADGVNSWQRAAHEAEFGTSIEAGRTRFTWLGCTKSWDSLTFFFERNQDGAFGVHIYPYAADRSTFIVETDEETWGRAGLAEFSEEDTIAYCERLFERQLEGHRLLGNRSLWTQFRTVHNRRWRAGNRVLIGDAAHTAHFSVGSGTKMALEDALALAQQLERLDDVPAALAAFEEERRPRVEHIQRMAASSFDWWAGFRHYLDWRPYRFSFHLLTRSLFRYDTLKERDPAFLAAVEEEAGEALLPRVVSNGSPEPGTELLLLGAAAVSADGRVTPADTSLHDLEPALSRAQRDDLAAGVQLLHAGARGACRPRSEGVDLPLPPELAWPLVSASSVSYGPGGEVPRELDQAGMERVAEDFAVAAAAAAEMGFDWLELQFGHGYLLGAFLSPLTNRRSDGFGGSLEGRLAFPLRVLGGVRRSWPAGRLLSVAISAEDHVPGGTTVEEALEMARRLREAGADCVTALSGQTVWRSAAPFARCFNMLAAGRIRNEAGVPAMAAGGITDLDDVRTVLLSGRADYVRLDSARLGAL